MPKIAVSQSTITCKLVLFDLDGTLVDKGFRNTALAKTRYNAIEKLAGNEAAKRWAQYSGVSLPSFKVDDNGPLSMAPRKEDMTVATTAIWQNGLNWFEARQIASDAYAMADAEQSRGFKPKLVDGATEALKKMRKAGLLLGIATNGSGKTAQEIMESIGVGDLFDVYIGADEVSEGKPAPDMILEACRRLEIDPGDSVYVGDELVDAVAGKAAGVAGIVIVSDESDVSQYSSLLAESVAQIRTVNPG
jgi:phosphoglycolate phosphatase